MELRRSRTRSLSSCQAGATAQTESLGGVAGTEARVARGEVTIPGHGDHQARQKRLWDG